MCLLTGGTGTAYSGAVTTRTTHAANRLVALLALALATPATSAAAPCDCATATSPRAFRTCVREALRALPPAERRAEPWRSLARLAATASCGRTATPGARRACCLPPVAPEVTPGQICTAARPRQCGRLGGVVLPGGTACTPHPCLLANDVPVAHTPPGGYGDAFPAPVLAACTEPLVAGAPDLAGMWKVVEVEVNGAPAAPDHPAYRHFQRVEQCGNRLVVTAGGVVHDMRCDGTLEGAVHDVAELDHATPITVVATYEDGVHVLRPVGIPIEVTRRRDGAHLVWTYLTFVARLERVGGPETPPPAT